MKPTPPKTLALPIVAGLCCAIPLDAVYAQRAPQPAPPLALGDCAPVTGAFVIAGTDTCLRIGGHLAVASAMRLGAQHLTLAEPSAQPGPSDPDMIRREPPREPPLLSTPARRPNSGRCGSTFPFARSGDTLPDRR